ncbi:DUF3488 and transglutaminase-like domain-containing protein [Microbacterium sp. 18062]|uniref:transglutaminase family protein n=1 Tax=Microbacterium sp. 18062 TaxID=2681410 RepID=UPI00135C9BDE|nr:DUF3488 and transglutaminase-like domain-containing protein [Microbacterium sp. 18062]
MARSERIRRRGTVALAIGILTALVATIMPVTRVIAPGWWVAGGIALAAVTLTVGVVLRRLRVPSLGATLGEGVAWVVLLTVLFFRDTAWFGIVPSPGTLRLVPEMLSSAIQQITVGAAPLAPSVPLSFFVVAAVGALAIVLDHVVVTTRMPLLGAVALVAVALVPTIAVPAPMDVGAFVLLGVSILFLLRTDTRTRQGAAARRPSAASATALAIGAVSVVVAVVLTPLLPAPDNRAGPIGEAGSSGINPTLRLGDDLRRPNPVEVLRLHTSGSRAPYLRAVTLSTFAGEVWRPDEAEPEPIGTGAGFGAVPTSSDVPLEQEETHIEVERLSTSFLPVPFPATAIGGLTGDWGVVSENRTVIGIGTDSAGQNYEVLTEAPRPSLEQIRGAPSRGADLSPGYTEIPEDTPQLITDLALEVTAGAGSDYDAAAALQRWFRSSEFRYSLEAPVEAGFDGAGVDAIEQFLIEREGYCVHFASAFAVMTRSLGMPTRVVIGYLPGIGTADAVDDRMVYSVTSDLLHAWPEVYFEGIGWVGFEPTNSLGAPPTFSSAGGTAADRLDDEPEEAAPEPIETTAPTDRPDTPDSPDAGAAPGADGSGGAVSATLIVLVALLVLAAPGLVRGFWRRRQLAAARSGQERAAWAVVQDTAIDLGILAPASESPRAFGARLIAQHAAPPEAVQALVAAVEHASYAPADSIAPGRMRGDRGLADAAAAVRAALLASAAPAGRMLAAFVPRSLVIRPGSAAAGSGDRLHAR